jgi:hypothetical protein
VLLAPDAPGGMMSSMPGINRHQAKLLQQQINRIYNRRYVTLQSSDQSLDIGDVFESRLGAVDLILKGSLLTPTATMLDSGVKINRNIASSSEVSLTFKAAGEAKLNDIFKLEEAGFLVSIGSKNAMFLKLLGMRQEAARDFMALRKAVLERFVTGALSPRVFVVRGIVRADRYLLVYSGGKDGQVALNVKVDAEVADLAVDGAFKVGWSKNVGAIVDAPDGGPLAYRVSGIRVRRQHRTRAMGRRILDGANDVEALSDLSESERHELLQADALDLVDATPELEDELEDELEGAAS